MAKQHILRAAEFYLPTCADYSAWSVVACDQFTSEPEYWQELENFVGTQPSALRMVLPEIYLGKNDMSAVEKINATMYEYLKSGVLKNTGTGLILVSRTTPYVNRRIGLMAAVDLEYYDFRDPSAIIRATEGTIEERIPPRLAIRENAPLEFSHVMLLYEDETRSINEQLYAHRDEYEKIYDFELNMGGGKLEGRFIADYAEVLEKFSALGENKPFLFAVGDGNHSLATAKAHWDKLKCGLDSAARETHPARYCLVEIVNIYDEGIYFEPIHRFVKGVNVAEFIKGLEKSEASFTLYKNGEKPHTSNAELPDSIRTVDEYIKKYVAEGGAVDYVHGDGNLKKLVDGDASSVGIMFEKLDKSELFSYVARKGALPRKTFSMGEGVEKRYYTESKAIRYLTEKE